MATLRYIVTVADDATTATVAVEAGKATDYAALEAALAEASVIAGIDTDVGRELAERAGDPEFGCAPRQIATKVDPIQAGPARLVFHKNPGLTAGHQQDSGNVDFWDRELLTPVSKDEVVGEYQPATSAKAGSLVDGTEIPAPPSRHKEPELGPGLFIDDEGHVRTNMSGVLLEANSGRLGVVEHYEHSGAIDMKSGNLDANGSLSVRGNINRNFVAYARGDLEIGGTIEGGSAYATGWLKVSGGVLGSSSSHVSVQGDAAIRHGQDALIECGEKLEVERDLVGCRVQARHLRVGGRIRGGTVLAELSVEAAEIGSAHNADTCIAVAVPLDEPIVIAREALAQARAHRLTQRRARGTLRSSPRSIKGRKTTATNTVSARLDKRHRARVRLLLKRASITTARCHAGVVLCFGSLEHVVEAETTNVTFRFDAETKSVYLDRKLAA